MNRIRHFVLAILGAVILVAALALLVIGPAVALAAPAGPVPSPCETQECVYAPRAELEALVRQAYEAGRAAGLTDCKLKSGAWL